jgi:hypothetical protein
MAHAKGKRSKTSPGKLGRLLIKWTLPEFNEAFNSVGLRQIKVWIATHL